MNGKVKLITGALVGTVAAVKAAQIYNRNTVAANVDGTGKTVLITGGSNGIGRELANIFARHNFNLVLAARNEDKLAKTVEELKVEYNVDARYIAVDLSKPDGAKKLYSEICQRNIVIDQFVNNAGAGKSSDLVDTDADTLVDLINLNVTSFTLLNKYIAFDMVKRGGGKILNVASLSGYLPDPGLNVYGPTKAYERYMGEAMYGELLGTGVKVSTLCPGPVKTNWSANAGRKDSKFSLDVKEVAKEAFVGMQNDELIIVPTCRFKALRLGANFVPTTVKIRLLRAFQNNLKE